ncbi:hypothetical protein [Serratia oryzae]|uniref:Uncharacterized protein n=1 Tax=Serratia oryzae TaxID=2034155 RepID=A0A1S8CHS9_9GAMM|nr:hypothetical protein [Serratia oryzae]OMQ22174.1 hypothetical protein BMI79_11675 [Serratia oryzae]
MDSDIIAFETLLSARDALLATQETAKWTFWIMVATWVAGCATFAAVVVSLYIANRKPISRITSTCGTAIVSPSPGISLIGLSLNVANIGMHPVVISSITWVCNGDKQLVFVFNTHASDKLPKKLEHGESAMFFIEFNNFADWKADLLNFIEKANGKVKKLQYVVTLGTGQSVTFKPDKELMNTLTS